MKIEKPNKAVAKRASLSAECTPVSAISFSTPIIASIDKWAERNGVYSRSDAIRRLVEKGLAASAKSTPLKADDPETTKKISDIAGKQIDLMSDPTATDDEREIRKLRLLRGPREFRPLRKKNKR